MTQTWTQLLGEYKGNEIVSSGMISIPINGWGSIDSNVKHYKVIYRAENTEKALEIIESWKNETNNKNLLQ